MLKKILILASFALLATSVFAFDNLKVHLALTGAAAELYNNQTSEKLSTQQIKWLVQGSQAEDTDPRYINHYYNPTTGKGLDSDDTIYGITKHFTGISAKNWAKQQDNSLVGLTGDYSIGAILENYKLENYDRAYQGVGHIMHLVQDMAVPAHTRNDSHAMGDPFEDWAKAFDKPMPGGATPQEFGTLDLAFDGLATFSNNNFYSIDTISEKSIDQSLIKKEKDFNGNTALYVYNNGYKILKAIKNIDGYKYDFDYNVHLDYWNLLAPQAIGYSEGVIDYFIKQFKQVDQEKEQANLNLWQKTQNTLAGLWNGAKYTTGDTILAESVQLQEKGAAGYALSKLGSGLGLAILDQAADQKAKQAKIAVADALNQTNNVLGNAVDQTGQAANQAAVLGQKVINAITKPIIKENPLAPSPASAETIITENPAPLAPDSVTEQTTIIAPGETPQPFPLWIFTHGSSHAPAPSASGLTSGEVNGTSTATTTPPDAITTPPDIIAPQLTIISAPSPFISSTSVEFEFSADETPVIFACRLDNTDWQSCEASTTFENLGEGNHLLEAKAIDAANNESATASSTWLVDVTAPTASFAALDSEYPSSSIPVYWTGEDNMSGLAGFDLEYQIATSSSPVDVVWQTWFTATSATSSIFDQTATSGDIILFRVRATDRANTVGDWSEAQTTITLPPPPVVDKVVISEIYGGGGNSGAVYKNDFIELYNPTDHAISLDGWSVQYAAATGNFGSNSTALSGSIASKSYYLIQESAGAGGTTNLPAPDASGTIAMAATAGKVALTTDLTPINSATSASVMDFVGYGSTANQFEGSGPAPAPSNTASIERSGEDTDNNNSDFVVRPTPGPQSFLQSSGELVCTPLEPAFNGVYSTRIAIANKTTSTSTPAEPIFIVDITTPHQVTDFYAPVDACGINKAGGWPDSSQISRTIIEFGYDPATKLFNGKHRFCTDGGNPYVISSSGDRCRDGSFWYSSRWINGSNLAGSSEVLIKNFGKYLPWLKIE